MSSSGRAALPSMLRLTVPALPTRLICFQQCPNMITQSHGDLEHQLQLLTPRSIELAAGVERSHNLIQVSADRTQLCNRALESGEQRNTTPPKKSPHRFVGICAETSQGSCCFV